MVEKTEKLTFEEYWAEVEKLRVLPYIAIKQLPSSFSAEIKKWLKKLGVEKTAELLNAAIDEVNSGSIENSSFVHNRRKWDRMTA